MPEEPTPPPIQNPPEDALQMVADKIGFIPNLRKEDNAFQAKFVGATTLIAAIVGAAGFQASGSGPWWAGALMGVLGGALLGLLISGTILAIKNLKR